MTKVLVTGGAGFIGSHLVDLLIKEGYEVHVWDNFSTGHHYTNDNAKYIQLNIGQLSEFKYKEKYETIYHLAAKTRIQPSFTNPKDYLWINSHGTMNILEWARYNGGQIIYASSSSAIFPGLNPYSYSKSLGERHINFYNHIYGSKHKVCRLFNVYGPRQIRAGVNATLLGIFENQYINKQSLTITGNGTQKRAFTYVDDIVKGLYQASLTNDTYIDLGCSIAYSVNEVAQFFDCPIQYIDKRPGEISITHLPDKPPEGFNWQATDYLKSYIKEFKSKYENTNNS